VPFRPERDVTEQSDLLSTEVADLLSGVLERFRRLGSSSAGLGSVIRVNRVAPLRASFTTMRVPPGEKGGGSGRSPRRARQHPAPGPGPATSHPPLVRVRELHGAPPNPPNARRVCFRVVMASRELLQRVADELHQAELTIGKFLMEMVAGHADPSMADSVDQQIERLRQIQAELHEAMSQ
jgi:hypothetical protein